MPHSVLMEQEGAWSCFNLMGQALLTLDRRPSGTADGGMDWGVREVAGESVVGM